jgi:hypothetical protein
MSTHPDMNCNHREHFTILITHHLCARSRVPVSTTWALVARRLLKFAHYGQATAEGPPESLTPRRLRRRFADLAKVSRLLTSWPSPPPLLAVVVVAPFSVEDGGEERHLGRRLKGGLGRRLGAERRDLAGRGLILSGGRTRRVWLVAA